MWVITNKGKPIGLEDLMDRGEVRSRNLHPAERESFLCGPTKRKTKELYLESMGYTWPERVAGIEVERFVKEFRLGH